MTFTLTLTYRNTKKPPFVITGAFVWLHMAKRDYVTAGDYDLKVKIWYAEWNTARFAVIEHPAWGSRIIAPITALIYTHIHYE